MMHVHLIECDSTQDVLKEQLRMTAGTTTVLVSCENQLKGRGRGDHLWSTMEGTLCFSIGLAAHHVPSFTALEISVLIARFFELKGKKLGLKWPNDLFSSDGKKCAGILVQNSADMMMTGIGLNLFSESVQFGGVFDSAFPIDKESWSEEIAFFIIQNRYLKNSDLVSDWNERCLHLHMNVQIEESGERKSGIFMGLGENGEALLQTENGIEHLYNGSLKIISR